MKIQSSSSKPDLYHIASRTWRYLNTQSNEPCERKPWDWRSKGWPLWLVLTLEHVPRKHDSVKTKLFSGNRWLSANLILPNKSLNKLLKIESQLIITGLLLKNKAFKMDDRVQHQWPRFLTIRWSFCIEERWYDLIIENIQHWHHRCSRQPTHGLDEVFAARCWGIGWRAETRH